MEHDRLQTTALTSDLCRKGEGRREKGEVKASVDLRSLSPAVAWVTHRLCHDNRVSNGRLFVHSEVREAIVQQLLLVGEVGDKAAIKLVAEGRADCLHTGNVIAYADLVRFPLYRSRVNGGSVS